MLPGLTLHSAATRAEALLRERVRLLREVTKKKQQLEQAHAASERAHDARASKMEPLIARHESLVADLTKLFDELLGGGRLAARARKAVEQVRRALEEQGILPPRDEDDDLDGFDPEEEEREIDAFIREQEGDESDERPFPDVEPSSGPRDVPSARRPEGESRTLRDIFRALVRAVHPDHAREEAERVRRTEVMKQVTQAFEQGDLARLIELERAWKSERVLAGEGDAEQRCRELERINRELWNQSKQLASAIRAAKRELTGPFAQLDELFEQASTELDDIAAICEFVKQFRDGRISLAAFSRGPLNPSSEPEAPRPKRRRKRT